MGLLSATELCKCSLGGVRTLDAYYYPCQHCQKQSGRH
jgi:hypothetical protein